MKPFKHFKTHHHSFITFLGLLGLFFSPLSIADGVVVAPNVPNNQKPQINQAGNGVPIVNIQTPSKGGVSHNKYDQFNVNQQGLIFNNSHQNSKTQLGGYINGNPNLIGGHAKIILNEVVGNNRSQLNGAMEIAGSRAQLVIANPAGISCAGCGFINAGRVTLTTGVPQMNNGNLTGFTVNQGNILIDGLGMNAAGADYTDLIARSVVLNAQLWASDKANPNGQLNIVTGRNQVSLDTQTINKLVEQTNALPAQPEFSVDVAALGGMYAGKIRLTGTEQGVGVKNAGHIGASVGNVQINSAGKLLNTEKGSIYGDNILIEAKQVENLGKDDKAPAIAARNNLLIGTDELINKNHALLFGANNVSIGQKINTDLSGTTGRANLIENASATIEALNNLSLSAQTIKNLNLDFATHQVEIDRYKIYEYLLDNSTTRYSPDQIHISKEHKGKVNQLHTPDGKDFKYYYYDYERVITETQILRTDPGKLLAGGNINIDADILLNDKSRIMAGGDFNATVNHFDNIELLGSLITTDTGTVEKYWRKKKKKYPAFKYVYSQGKEKNAYQPAPEVEKFNLEGIAAGGQTFPDSGNLGALSSLFGQVTDPSKNYLIETDPRFSNYRTWLSSDYFFNQLQGDPIYNQKRLGDGFLEQKLLREQIAQLTGKRFLKGYQNDEEQYKALIDSGIAYGNQWQLVPGVALSAKQMNALTHDIVWMVTEEVTLPNGTKTHALVPKVYLAQGSKPLGGVAVVVANNIHLNVNGQLTNQGLINASNNLNVLATDVHNNGNIQANNIDIKAKNNINHQGGSIQGDGSVTLYAQNDLNIQSQTNQTQSNQGTKTNIDRVASVVVTGKGGTPSENNLNLAAHNNINLDAALILNDSEKGKTNIIADNNIQMGTVTSKTTQSNVWDKDNWLKEQREQEIGSHIQTNGDITLSAGNNVYAKGVQIDSDKGDLVAVAGKDITISAAMSRDQVDSAHKQVDKGGLSKRTEISRSHIDQTRADGSSIGAQNIHLQSGNDLNIIGSSVIATKDLNLNAKNDVNIVAAQETSDNQYYSQVKKSGMFSSGGIGFTIGTQKQTLENDGVKTNSVGSTVGSIEGNVNINSKHDYNQLSSTVIAPKGDINVLAGEINIVALADDSKQTSKYSFEQNGLSVAISNPILNAIQTVDRMQSAKKRTDNKRARALADATSAMSSYNALSQTDLASMDASKTAGQNAEAAGGINISITVGTTQNKSTTKEQSSTHTASNMQAGGNINLTAKNDAEHQGTGNVNILGSQIKADNDINLSAQNDLNLIASKDITSLKRDSKGHSAGVGVALNLGSNGWSLGITANASGSRGKAIGNDILWNNSHVEAGNKLNLTSGKDTNLIGGVAKGKEVAADIGGNLHIQSQQDERNYKSKDQSIGGSVTVGYGFSASANYSKDKINSEYQSVYEQSGIRAGDNGFNINVGKHTQLDGAVITSNQSAIDKELNHFSTGTLDTTNIKNKAEYSASSMGIGGGFSSGSKSEKPEGSKVASYGEEGKTTGSATNPTYISDSGNSSSTTISGISDGEIEIRDKEAQVALTGKTAEETLNKLDTKVNSETDYTHRLEEIFDEDKIKANIEITQAFINEVQTFSQNKVKQANDAKERYENETDPEKKAEYFEEYQNAAKWAPGGQYSQILTAITSAAGGNVSGSLGDLGTNALINYVQGLGAQQIKKIADSLKDGDSKTAESESVRGLLHGLLACAGSSAKGGDCAAGALGAAGSVGVNNLLDALLSQDAKDMTPQEKLDRENLVGTILVGISEGSGQDTQEVLTAGNTEFENNTGTGTLQGGWNKAQSDLQKMCNSGSDYGCKQFAANLLKGNKYLGDSEKWIISGITLLPIAGEADALTIVWTGKDLTGEETNRLWGVLGLATAGYGQKLKIVNKVGKEVKKGEALVQKAEKSGDVAKKVTTNVEASKKATASSNFGTHVTNEKQVVKSIKDAQYVDIISPDARKHILYGDATGGGHMYPGVNGKSTYPKNWTENQIIHNVGDIATSPKTQWYAQTGSGGKFTKTGKNAR